jgi:hypothetical protein
MSHAKARVHHTSIGKALQAKDHAAAMHHVGHLMIALRGMKAASDAGALDDAMGETADERLMHGREEVGEPEAVNTKPSKAEAMAALRSRLTGKK